MTAAPPAITAAPPASLRTAAPLDPVAFATVRRRVILDYHKWDPQVGDVSTLADFPLVLSAAPAPQEDLAHTLLRYQQAGIEILAQPIAPPAPPTPIRVRRPTWFRRAFQRLLATAALRRHPLGGFGGTLPEPSAG